jgi:Fur family ferric uptake transcriptional regulator
MGKILRYRLDGPFCSVAEAGVQNPYPATGNNYNAIICNCNLFRYIIISGKGAGVRTSSIELAIIELLNKDQHHLTAQEVYHLLFPRFPAINPSTVYRALERLADAGKVSVSDLGTGASVYEAVSDRMHHHLVCRKCGRIRTVDHALVGELFNRIEDAYSFRVETNHLILFGICPECRKKDGIPESRRRD